MVLKGVDIDGIFNDVKYSAEDDPKRKVVYSPTWGVRGKTSGMRQSGGCVSYRRRGSGFLSKDKWFIRLYSIEPVEKSMEALQYGYCIHGP